MAGGQHSWQAAKITAHTTAATITNIIVIMYKNVKEVIKKQIRTTWRNMILSSDHKVNIFKKSIIVSFDF